MCTLSWCTNTDGYGLVFNRDERKRRRRASPPALKCGPEGVRYLSPTDPESGGSWIVANQYGLTVCLLNAYHGVSFCPPDRTHSRGNIPLFFSDCRNLPEAEKRVGRLPFRHYPGFSLVIFDRWRPPVQYGWDTCTLRRVSPSMPLTSSSYRAEEVCQNRRRLFAKHAPKTLQQLLEFHCSHEGPGTSHAPCMHREDAQTVSQCVVETHRTHTSFRYADSSPCCTALASPLKLRHAPEQTAAEQLENKKWSKS